MAPIITIILEGPFNGHFGSSYNASIFLKKLFSCIKKDYNYNLNTIESSSWSNYSIVSRWFPE